MALQLYFWYHPAEKRKKKPSQPQSTPVLCDFSFKYDRFTDLHRTLMEGEGRFVRINLNYGFICQRTWLYSLTSWTSIGRNTLPVIWRGRYHLSKVSFHTIVFHNTFLWLLFWYKSDKMINLTTTSNRAFQKLFMALLFAFKGQLSLHWQLQTADWRNCSWELYLLSGNRHDFSSLEFFFLLIEYTFRKESSTL